MEIIEPDYAQEAIERVAAGEDLDSVWNSSPRRELTAADIRLEEDGNAVNPMALQNYANAEYKRWMAEAERDREALEALDGVDEPDLDLEALEADERQHDTQIEL